MLGNVKIGRPLWSLPPGRSTMCDSNKFTTSKALGKAPIMSNLCKPVKQKTSLLPTVILTLLLLNKLIRHAATHYHPAQASQTKE